MKIQVSSILLVLIMVSLTMSGVIILSGFYKPSIHIESATFCEMILGSCEYTYDMIDNRYPVFFTIDSPNNGSFKLSYLGKEFIYHTDEGPLYGVKELLPEGNLSFNFSSKNSYVTNIYSFNGGEHGGD